MPTARSRLHPRTVRWILGGAAAFIAAAAITLSIGVYIVAHPSVTAVAEGRTTIAAVSDSNTYGYGVIFDDLAGNSYPAQLGRRLGDEYQVLNYGLSGATLLDSGDSPWRAYPFDKASRDADPEVVLIMLGTNDSKPQNWDAQQYRAQLTAFVDSYRILPQCPDVYLLTPPAAFENSFGVDPVIVREEVTPIVEEVAAATGVPVIDVFAATDDRRALFSDGVHPGAVGYRIIAELVDEAVTP